MYNDLLDGCNRLINMLDEDPDKLSSGIKGDILEQYSQLMTLEKECMETARGYVVNAIDQI